MATARRNQIMGAPLQSIEERERTLLAPYAMHGANRPGGNIPNRHMPTVVRFNEIATASSTAPPIAG